MNEIWHALGFATLAIFAAGLAILYFLAQFATEASEARLITNLTLRRVLWVIACFFWSYELVFLRLNVLWIASPGRLYAASLTGAIVITGFIAIRRVLSASLPEILLKL